MSLALRQWLTFARLDRVPAVREAALKAYLRAAPHGSERTALVQLKLRDSAASIREIAQRELAAVASDGARYDEA